MPNETTHFTSIQYDGGNPLVRQILTCYDRVIKDRSPSLMAAEESKVFAVSASALYDLGTRLLQPSIQHQLRLETLGARTLSMEEARPQVYEAVRFFALEVLQRWYASLKGIGLEPDNLAKAIEKIKAGEITTTKGIVGLVNKFAVAVADEIKIGDIKPKNGWERLNEELEFEEMVRRGELHIGVYL